MPPPSTISRTADPLSRRTLFEGYVESVKSVGNQRFHHKSFIPLSRLSERQLLPGRGFLPLSANRKLSKN